MNIRRRALSAAILAIPLGASRRAAAQAPISETQPVPASANLFAVEFRVGPKWDAAKQAHEQAHFRDHSANLKRLRDNGSLLVGARYSDKGFLVVAGESEASVRALIEVDPSVANQVFAYEVHSFNVFYSGCVQAPKRPT